MKICTIDIDEFESLVCSKKILELYKEKVLDLEIKLNESKLYCNKLKSDNYKLEAELSASNAFKELAKTKVKEQLKTISILRNENNILKGTIRLIDNKK